MKKLKSLAILLAPLVLSQPSSGQWIINEILADPAVGSDPNGDGNASTTEDEFVEIVNMTGAAVDIENWTINDGFGLRHTFVGSTIVADGQAVVVFGGGSPTGAFGGSVVQVSSEGSLGFNNGGDTVTLFDGSFNQITFYDYGSEGGSDQSLTRDPDLTGGSLVEHATAAGSGGAAFSPGTQVGGAPFGGEAITVGLGSDFINEGDGNPATTGTITLSSAAVENLVVTLTSSDDSEATVPATVTVLSGQTTANFDVTVVNDSDIDGNQETTISASADGFFTGTAVLTVTDNEDPLPVVTLTADPTSIPENGGTTTITIEVDVADPAGYSFSLSSNNPGTMTVPESVSIAPNETSATFTGTAVDNATSEGTRIVTVTAADDADVILDAQVSVSVTDDEFTVPTGLLINEIRIDDPGDDDDEYLEIYSETANASLDSLTLVVIGDSSAASGALERAISLDGFNANGNYFLIGSSTMTLAVPDLTTGMGVFENSDNLTFLLVTDFSGAEGDDLDTNDDGTLDVLPWTSIVDGVALWEGIDPPEAFSEFEYSAQLGLPRVGPDGPFVPGHVYRDANNGGDFSIGVFDQTSPEASDTPGAVNVGGGVDPGDPEEVLISNISVNEETGRVVLTATGLGTATYIVESSVDLGNADAWAEVPGGVSEVDVPEGVNFIFTDPEATTAPKLFYRIVED